MDIGNRELIILIDSGSTHNFLDKKLAQSLQLAVTPIKEFMVKVANGESLVCRERYEHVSITVLRISILHYFLFLTTQWARFGVRHTMVGIVRTGGV